LTIAVALLKSLPTILVVFQIGSSALVPSDRISAHADEPVVAGLYSFDDDAPRSAESVPTPSARILPADSPRLGVAGAEGASEVILKA
jgi:hypothetical protein